MDALTGRAVLDDDAIYMGDNGVLLHGRCCGLTARITGRDISGKAVELVTPAELRAVGISYHCEKCHFAGKGAV